MNMFFNFISIIFRWRMIVVDRLFDKMKMGWFRVIAIHAIVLIINLLFSYYKAHIVSCQLINSQVVFVSSRSTWFTSGDEFYLAYFVT